MDFAASSGYSSCLSGTKGGSGLWGAPGAGSGGAARARGTHRQQHWERGDIPGSGVGTQQPEDIRMDKPSWANGTWLRLSARG